MRRFRGHAWHLWALALAAVITLAAGLFAMRQRRQSDAPASPQGPTSQVDRSERTTGGLVEAGWPIDVKAAGTPFTTPPELEKHRADSESIPDAGPPTLLSSDLDCGFAPRTTRLTDTHFVVDINGQSECMFLFRLTGVKGKTVRVDLKGVPLRKWCTLNPVFRYDSDASIDPPVGVLSPLKETTSTARNGAFLPDETGQAWHFIREVWAERNTTLSFVQTFEKDSALVAMKVPFTTADVDEVTKDLRGKTAVEVVDVGRSVADRPLRAIVLSSGTATASRLNPCIVMYAREHADEHDSSWAVVGAMRWLTSGQADAENLRRQFTFIFIPLLDPDGAAQTKHENVIFSFNWDRFTPESLAWATFFKTWISKGNRLDVVLDMHNMESAEMEHLSTGAAPPMGGPFGQPAATLYTLIAGEADRAGYATRGRAGQIGQYGNLLGSWLSDTYQPVLLLIECNSQESHRHLSLTELEQLGALCAIGATRFLEDTDGQALMARTDRLRAEYTRRWAAHRGEITTDNPFAAERACINLARVMKNGD